VLLVSFVDLLFQTLVGLRVLEIAFDKLQRSDRHTSGLAMRFPRILRIRTDKSVSEIDTLASARRLAEPNSKTSAV